MEFNINDPKNIVGFSSLMHSEDKHDIMELEKEIINGASLVMEEEENDTKQYQKDMERLANTYSLGDATDEFKQTDYQEYNQESDQYNQNTPHYNTNTPPQNQYDDDVEDKQLKYMTIEQKKQNYVDDVFQDIDNDEDLEFDIDKEKDEDDKNGLLEQIDMLRDTLDDDGINLTNVPEVSKENSISDIKNIYKILRLKNDRNRYCSFAEEIILSGAYGVEYLFDGKNEWFGRTPDLVGWSNTVRVKLRRCRFQTSTLIKEMMQDYNMGPGVQLILELIPSMFLYSRQKNRANNDSISEDSQYNAAISNLNEQMG